jgi:lipopolysaccharide transport system permease protein
MKTIVIEKTSGWKRISFPLLYSFREVLWMLLERNLKSRYAQTAVGVTWIVFQPLLTVFLFSLIFGKWIQLSSDGTPYFLFAFSGLCPWIFLSTSIQRASLSLLSDSRLISKVYFPRLLLPIASLIETFLELLVLSSILVLTILLFHYPLTWKLFLFPLWTAPLILLSLGIGALFSSLGLYYRDFMVLLPFFTQTWMYCSPILYSSSMIPEKWLWLYSLNPVVGIIDAMRWSFLGLPHFPLKTFCMGSVVSFIVAAGGAAVFSRLERNFADVV